MNVKMEVLFSTDEVADVMKLEYVRIFGEPATGYELDATSKSWGEVEVRTVKTYVEPAPIKEEIDEGGVQPEPEEVGITP